MTLTGRRTGQTFRLGDRVKVTVAHVDVDRRELDFQFVDRVESAKPKKKTAGAPKTKPTKRQQSKTRAKSRANKAAKANRRKGNQKSPSHRQNKRRR